MIDFLKNNPTVTKGDYLWKWTVPQIRLASYDFTRVNYLTEEEANARKTRTINSAEDLMSDFGLPIGIPVFNKTEKQ